MDKRDPSGRRTSNERSGSHASTPNRAVPQAIANE